MKRLQRKIDVKKTLTRFGEIAIIKTNPSMVGLRPGFGISPYMQELMTYAGHLECYARSHEILEQFLSIKVSP
ncbi:MAG: ISLre2 family transposase, partial [Tannerella sp.]|nr:ISLre2 family transposase [Tannerella sp.]